MEQQNRIQYYRKRQGMSQEELGEQLYVSRQTVSQWETGQTQPSVDNLARLRDIFGVSIDDILGLTPMTEEGEAPAGSVPPPAEPAPAEPAPAESAPAAPPPPARDPMATQRVVGYILLAVGLVALLVGLFLSGLVAVAGGLLVLGGILCLTVRWHLGLVLSWVYWAVCQGLTILLTGVVWLNVAVSEAETVSIADMTADSITTVEEVAVSRSFFGLSGVLLVISVAWLIANVVLTVCAIVRANKK